MAVCLSSESSRAHDAALSALSTDQSTISEAASRLALSLPGAVETGRGHNSPAYTSPSHPCKGVELGPLHGTLCMFEQYLEIDCDGDDRYDLVDGVLLSVLDMSDSDHNAKIVSLTSIIRDQNCTDSRSTGRFKRKG